MGAMKHQAMLLDELTMGGPGLDGYAYNADVYCIDCGQSIIRELVESGKLTEMVEDSEECPQPIFFGESDHPQHCGECGEYLYGEDDSDDSDSEDEEGDDVY